MVQLIVGKKGKGKTKQLSGKRNTDLGKHTEGMDGGDKAEKERVVGTPLPDGENGKGKR